MDEAFNIGKGANAVISILHHFFHHHGLGETTAHLHADNCSGQNKNRYMMGYLMWRVLTGLDKEITISFLPVGHTKFAPDWCFGLFKQRFRRMKINTLDDIAAAVDTSSVVNVSQLVGTLDGQCLVPTYNWSDYLDKHTLKTALKGSRKITTLNLHPTHLVQYSSRRPVEVMRRQYNSSKIPLGSHLTITFQIW